MPERRAHPAFSISRVAEALVIASITAGATGFVAVRVLDEKVSDLGRRMDRVEAMAEQRYDKIQGDLQRIYALVAETRPRGRSER